MANLLSSTIGSHFYGSHNQSNILLKTAGNTGDGGILLQNSAGGFKFQIYGNGTDYGFLDGTWADWDIRKTIDGRLYLNGTSSYYLQTNGHSYLSTLHVGDASNGVSLHVGSGSTYGVYTLDNARKYLVVSGDYYTHMALVATGSNNTNHGVVFSFVGTEGSTPRQWNLGISNQNPFLFSIGYNRTGDNNPHYGVGDGWSSEDYNHARLSIDRDGNTKIRGMLYVNGTSGGISTGSAVIHAGNIASQSVSYATTAGALSSMNISQFSNNSGYITSSASITGNAASATFARRITDPERIGFNVGGESNRFYPVVIYTGAASTSQQYSEFIIERGGYEDPGYTGIGFSTFNARFTYKPNGWGYQAQYFNLEQLSQTTPMLGDYVDQYQSSQAIIWLRGATRYNIYSVYGGITLLFSNEDGGSYSMAYGTYDPIDSPQEKATTAKYYDSTVRYAGTIYTGSNAVIHAGNIGSQSVSYASSAGAVAWTNVSSRPSSLSEFTNNLTSFVNRIEFQYSTDRYSQAWRNSSTGAYWWVTTDDSQLGLHRNGDGDKFYFSNGGDFWSSTNGWLSTALSGKLATGGTAANSSQLEGFSAYALVTEARGVHSNSDFVNGTLVTTDINANGWAGDSFIMEVSGKSYGSGTPFKLIMEGYLYADTIINVSAMSYGSYFPAPVKVMRYNGNIAFWWPRGSYWNSFEVHVRSANGDSWNRVTGITDSVDPASADKKISITPTQVIHTGNIASQSVSYAVTSGTSSATTQTNFAELFIENVAVATKEFVTSQGYLTSLPSHNHDDRYYTESESDGRFQPLENQRLSTSNGPTFAEVYTNGWFRNNNINTGLYNQNTGTHFYSNSSGSWAITGSGGTVELQFRSNHQSTLRGYVYADTSNNIGFLNDAGNWSLRMSSSRNAEIFGPELTINAANAGYSSINMNDGDEGQRIIHCNSNRIGFLTQAGAWGSYCNDDGSWTSVGNISGNYLYSNSSVRVGEIWGYGGLYRSEGSMLFGVEGGAGWSFRAGNEEKVWIANDGNIYMAWAGAYISTLLDAKQNASTAINTGNIGSQSVSYASSSGRSSALDIIGYGSSNMTYYQTPGTFAGYSGWAGYFVSNHGDGATYYNQTIIMPFWGAPQYSRLQGGTFVGPYTFWSTENLNDYAPNMNQYVRTTDNVTFNTTTSPTILVNGHSDNTKGYRIHNTSGSSVSAMFVNSSNQLVIAAGAVDQVNLNKKVYVNGVALGVNVSPSGTAGRIDASNDIVAYSSSDERLKHNIAPIENALDKVKSLTGVEFDWKPEYKHAHGYEGHDTGIIAQQVQDVMPSAVRTNDTGFLAVRYEKLIGLLIEGMKEQQAQIDELKAKLDGLTK